MTTRSNRSLLEQSGDRGSPSARSSFTKRKPGFGLQLLEAVELQLHRVIVVDVVQAHDRVAAGQQSPGGVKANEAGGAGNENFAHDHALTIFSRPLHHLLRRIPRIDDQPGMLDDEVVVVGRVVGGDQHGILGGQVFGRERATRHVGHVVVPHLAAAAARADRCRSARRRRPAAFP